MRRFSALIALLLGAGLFALLAPPVRALTLYAVGSEDTSFTAVESSANQTIGSGTIIPGRSPYENASVSVAYDASNPPANRWVVPFTSSSTVWFHAWFDSVVSNVPAANAQTLIFRSPDGFERVVLRQTGTFGQLKLSTVNQAGTFTDIGTATTNYIEASGNQLDVDINYTCSAAGSIVVYLNGSAIISFSGNPCTDTATSLDQAEFAALNAGSAPGSIWAEVIIADQDTRGMALVALPPQAAGAAQGWTPNTLANIAKQIINDSTFISTGSNSVKSEWTLPTTLPTGNFAVLGVAQEARTEVGTSGPQHYNWLLHISGSDFTTGSVAPTTSFGNNQVIWTTNPSTGTGWQPSDLTAGIQAGIESAP